MAHLERDLRQLIGAGNVSSYYLGVILLAPEAHEGMGVDIRAYADAVGLVRGRSHAVPPWPDQEARVAKYWVAIKALATYISGKSVVAPMFVEVSVVAFVKPRGQYHNLLVDLSRRCHLEG